MTNPITAKSSSETCRYYLDQLGWSWKHERVTDWLIRVQQHYDDKGWDYGQPIPEFVKESLAKFLKYRLECQQYLNALQWNWNHPEVFKVEQKFGTSGNLPLKGYEHLLAILQAEDPIHF